MARAELSWHQLNALLRDLHAPAASGGGGPVGDGGGDYHTPDTQFSISTTDKDFDFESYSAKRDEAAMRTVAANMNQVRYGRKQKVESVSSGWNPQRDFLSNGRNPLANWKRKP
jgi:hypothetical protein